MRKLRLELDSLAVESFEPQARPAAARGTVAGNLMAYVSFGCPLTGRGCDSWDLCLDTKETCPDTGWEQCGYSYGGTCGASPPVSLDVACDGAQIAGTIVDPTLCV
ncbi:MAG TPA: hypothetical protein VFH27_13730 [Longimicrobiaceae bacterium]|nr:hypothetical protein [Longimicrobiaceae bacterium]